MKHLSILIAVLLFATGGCHSLPEDKPPYTVYYYTTHDLMDMGRIDRIDTLPKAGYTAICRIPIRDKTFWEQEFVYEDSLKRWELYEVRIHKIVDDTLLKVESFGKDLSPIYPVPRDPEQLLIWGTDTIFTPVFFPMTIYADYLPERRIEIYDSTYTAIIHEQRVENVDKRPRVFDMIKKFGENSVRRILGVLDWNILILFAMQERGIYRWEIPCIKAYTDTFCVVPMLNCCMNKDLQSILLVIIYCSKSLWDGVKMVLCTENF